MEHGGAAVEHGGGAAEQEHGGEAFLFCGSAFFLACSLFLLLFVRRTFFFHPRGQTGKNQSSGRSSLFWSIHEEIFFND